MRCRSEGSRRAHRPLHLPDVGRARLDAGVAARGVPALEDHGALHLLPYQREETGQFERTLINGDRGAYVSDLEGCTAPTRDEHKLHAAVVELIALDDAEIKYSTVQNWYSGDKDGKGGIYNFVTKHGDCRGRGARISWTQVETGSAITWKYPSCILRGDNSKGEFYSIALSNGYQQVDSGTKMIQLGKNTSSWVISKGIAAGHSQNTYRGLVSAHRKAIVARNFSNCDSLLIGDKCGAHTVPYVEAKNASAHLSMKLRLRRSPTASFSTAGSEA
jgi:Fe-S cluster assembly protein SufB